MVSPTMELTVHVRGGEPPLPADGSLLHVGYSAGCTEQGLADLSPCTHTALKDTDDCEHGYRVFSVGTPLWRAFLLPPRQQPPAVNTAASSILPCTSRFRRYLVCGQSQGGYGSPPTVYQARWLLRGRLFFYG